MNTQQLQDILTLDNFNFYNGLDDNHKQNYIQQCNNYNIMSEKKCKICNVSKEDAKLAINYMINWNGNISKCNNCSEKSSCNGCLKYNYTSSYLHQNKYQYFMNEEECHLKCLWASYDNNNVYDQKLANKKEQYFNTSDPVLASFNRANINQLLKEMKELKENDLNKINKDMLFNQHITNELQKEIQKIRETNMISNQKLINEIKKLKEDNLKNYKNITYQFQTDINELKNYNDEITKQLVNQMATTEKIKEDKNEITKQLTHKIMELKTNNLDQINNMAIFNEHTTSELRSEIRELRKNYKNITYQFQHEINDLKNNNKEIIKQLKEKPVKDDVNIQNLTKYINQYKILSHFSTIDFITTILKNFNKNITINNIYTNKNELILTINDNIIYIQDYTNKQEIIKKLNIIEIKYDYYSKLFMTETDLKKVNNNMMSKEDININILNDKNEYLYTKETNILIILLFILSIMIIYNNQI